MKYVLFSAYYALKAALISEISLRVLSHWTLTHS